MGLALTLFNRPFIHRLLQASSSSASITHSTAHRTPRRALRVVRVVDEAQRGRSASTRVLISGSMDQVCAELDRLAALEAAA